jgi:hypothetical protein
MKRMKSLLLSGLLLLAACENKELFPPCANEGDALIEVIIHWEGKPEGNLPENMRVLWYLQDGPAGMYDKLLDRHGGYDRLPAAHYTPLCFDYYGNQLLDFRGFTSAESFEAYNLPATSLYNQYADPVPGEPTVAEAAAPYLFYVDGRPQTVNTESLPAGDTLRVHFYPENALREFTFLIYGVKGAKNMAKNGGAISGMSASYFPAENRLATLPSTLLFSRVEAIRNGQSSTRWTQEWKDLFADKNPDWQSADTTRGWTDDWITGRFSTFGPVDVNSLRFRLTIEALSNNNYYYYGAWGYWYGRWEDTVGKQVKGAMEGAGTGDPDERQTWWRAHNGGFDIVIDNEGRLVVPDEGGGQPGSGGGFDVGANEWITTPVTVE